VILTRVILCFITNLKLFVPKLNTPRIVLIDGNYVNKMKSNISED
jgi:hypothetical protein